MMARDACVAMEWQVAVMGGVEWYKMSACDKLEGKMRCHCSGQQGTSKGPRPGGWLDQDGVVIGVGGKTGGGEAGGGCLGPGGSTCGGPALGRCQGKGTVSLSVKNILS